MKTDLEVEVEVDLRQLGKVLIFRDRQTAPIIYKSSLPGITERVVVPGCVPRSAEFCLGASLSASGTLAFFSQTGAPTSKKDLFA